MTILGRGDLSPPRKHHHPWRWLAAIVALAVLAGGGYVGYQHFAGSSDDSVVVTQTTPCPTPTVPSQFATPDQVRIVLRNGSLRTGLAARVARQLRHRGIHVRSIGNAVRVGHDVAVVRYSSDQTRQARTVAAQVSGAALHPQPGQRKLELDLGLRFRHLRSAAQVRAVEQQAAGSATPSPSPGCTS
ncbi:MAG TPA: LytR C-terminal domain-containing protein [Mycobacteriales bacterium]|nr:LytR C-terminal domain-containing protein [Mycobacteriales bacterium]